MTPTEQDNELRRNICGIATGVLWGKNFNELTLNERSRVNAMAKDLEAYITTDRKRVALEAKIDELTKLRRMFERLAEYAGDKEQVMSEYDDRIAELKAKQEEV